MKRRRIVLAIPALVSACAFPVAVQPVATPAAEVATNRRIAVPAYYQIGPDILSLQRSVRPVGLAGSAHTWQLDLGYPLSETFRKVLDATFSSVSAGTAQQIGGPHYVFRFDLEEADVQIQFIPNFWSATARSDVGLLVRVRVFDQTGAEISRALVQGQGRGAIEGQIDSMNTSLAEASQRAIRNIGNDFVYKVINSGALANSLPPSIPIRRP